MNNDAYNFLDVPKSDDRFVTPESLAWDLVISEREDFTGIMQGFVDDSNGKYRANQYEQIADEFQLLITTYMEIVFNVLKSNFMGELLDEKGEIRGDYDLEDKLNCYKPDFKDFTVDEMNEMSEFFRGRFAKIRYFLSVRNITEFCSDDPNDFGLDSKYYCKILLLDDNRSFTKNYFKQATHIPEGKRYTFMLRVDDNPQQKKLEDFYAVVYLPPYKNDLKKKPRKIRISFEKLNIISADPHITN